MATATLSLVPDLLRVTTVATPDAPLPTPMSAPAYVPPSDPVIPLNPTIAPPPDGQFLGKGGTSFGLIPATYWPSMPLPYTKPGSELYALETRSQPGIAAPLILAKRPGDDANVPVPSVPVPIKPPIAETITAAQPPKGPISGVVAGFDLAKVPLWAWLVGAAVLGAKLFK
jgi:hypothetical protein